MKNTSITVEVFINAPIEKIWNFWIEPEHIKQWAFASDDWEASFAENDVRTGGKFKTTMAAKDKSDSFDFSGVYKAVIENKLIEYELEDGRSVRISFIEAPEGIKVIESFDPEEENTEELQRAGWQAILDNFKKHVEEN